MFCPNCGSTLEDGAKFCPDCGSNLSSEAAQAPPPPITAAEPQTVESAPAPAAAPTQTTITQPAPEAAPPPPVYAAPVAAKPKKKKHIGLWIFLIILLLIVGGGCYVYGTISWLPPKDLGVTYTKADYDSFVKKIGTIRDANPTISTSVFPYYIDEVSSNQNTSGKISDYNYVFSGSKKVNVSLTQEELTAWLNEGRPSYFAVKKSQIRINKDGSVEASGEIDFEAVKYLVGRSYPNFNFSSIPIPLPSKANVYLKASGSMTNNVPDLTSLEGSIGAVPVNTLLSKNNINVVESAITTVLAREVPQFKMKSISFADGKVLIDGEVPERVVRKPISAQ